MTDEEWNKVRFTITNTYYKTADGKVINVDLTISLSDEEDEVSYNTHWTFQNESSAAFIPYNELTEEVMVGWLQEELSAEIKAGVYDRLKEMLEDKKQPKMATGLPWAAAS